MAIQIRDQGNAARVSTTSQNLTLNVATNAGDCVVVIASSANATTASWSVAPFAISGLGATWYNTSTFQLLPGGGASVTNAIVFIGYNCAAGNTSISLTGFPNNTNATTLWGLFSGVKSSVNPVSSWSANTVYGAASTAVTSSSASYNAGDLVLGFGYSFGWSNGSATWSNGSTNTNIGSSPTGTRPPIASYIIPASTGSTTYTTPVPSSTNTATAGIMVLSASSSNGNMLLAMSM